MGKYHKGIRIEGADEFLLAVNITGHGAPTEDTEAEPGMCYLDEDSEHGDLYKCIGVLVTETRTVYRWKKLAGQEEVDSLSEAIDDLKENGTGDGTSVSTIEPADDDIPKVYFTGTLPTSKDDGDVQVKVHYISKTEDFTYPATLKVQGSSSANYAKKNFTLKLYEDETYEKKVKREFKGWGKLNKFVLKAHWIDHSHVRNVGTAKIWGKIVKSRSDYDSLPEELRSAPNNGATDGFTCKVFANGVYQGLYEWIVPKDKLFGQDSDIATHSILNSEWNNQPTCAFATTSPRINGNWSEELQDSMSSEISTSFANFIKFVAGAIDEEFVANAENYFDVQSVIDFNIFARVFCIVDNLCRNQIFFTYDGVKWYEGCWDVDAVLGLPPTTREFFAYNTDFQTGYIAYKDYGVTNMLYQRIETLFADRLKERYAELRSGVLSIENILEVYERLTDVITTYDGLLAEDFASTTGGGAFTGIPFTSQNNIQQIRAFVSQRIPYMDGEIKSMINPIPATSIMLSSETLSFDNEESKTLTATVEPKDTTDSIVWESLNTSVAKVFNGLVTPVANGSTVIKATAGTVSAQCSVIVALPTLECTGISLNHEGLSFTNKETQTLVATVTPDNTTDVIEWSSDNNEVATVSGGVVTPVSNGNCTITATCGSYSASCVVEVSAFLDNNIMENVTWEAGTILGNTGAWKDSLWDRTSSHFDIAEYAGRTIRYEVTGLTSLDAQKLAYFDANGVWIKSDYTSSASHNDCTIPVNAATARAGMHTQAIETTKSFRIYLLDGENVILIGESTYHQ